MKNMIRNTLDVNKCLIHTEAAHNVELHELKLSPVDLPWQGNYGELKDMGNISADYKEDTHSMKQGSWRYWHMISNLQPSACHG